MRRPELLLTFDDGTMSGGVTMAITLSDYVASLMHIEPPPPFPVGGKRGFDRVVEVLRRKQYRRDLFVKECERLGELLSERMEDAEGWHDASRVEPAKAQLRERF